MNSTPDSLTGQTLGQFEILDEIGRGGMATVYRARQASINRTVAVKVLPRILLHDPSFYERFMREVDLIAHLEHPHILPIYDFGEAEGIPFIAMRYLGGGSMAQWIRRSVPPLSRLSRPFTQVAAALDYAHGRGIIHRDLKPGNILLDENENAYLSDFGIARVLDSNLTGSAIIGTPAYMSPEQAHGQQLDARSDVYALGIVMYEIVTGREPFKAETPLALMLKQVSEKLPSPRDTRPDLPMAAELVIYKATAKQREERYGSAGELAAAFSAALQGVSDSDATAFPTIDPQLLDEPTITPTPQTPLPLGRATPPPAPPPATPQKLVAVPVEAVEAAKAEAKIKQPAQTRGSNRLIYVGAVVAALALVGVGLVASQALTPGDPPQITATPPPTVIPTPFENAYTVTRADYTISAPDGWSFNDFSNEIGTVHVWQLDQRAFIGLWLVDEGVFGNIDSTADLADAFEASESVDRANLLTRIDQDMADDGTLRRSYQFGGENTPGFPGGQSDYYFMRRGDQFVVIEMYAAYNTGNELIPTFQNVLDSLVIRG